MIFFQEIRTARFSFLLQELSIAQARALLNIPPYLIEKARTAFLTYAIKELKWHKPYENHQLTDLTAQERLFIEATYLSATSETADFVIANGHYSNYLQTEKQFKYPRWELGTIPNDSDIWILYPLTGLQLEIIEERIHTQSNIERLDWIAFTMAAQLLRSNEIPPDIQQDSIAYGDYLEKRATQLLQLPESDFIALMSLYFDGLQKTAHLFDLNFDQFGIITFPVEKTYINEQGEEVERLPARFRSTSTLTFITQRLCGKFETDQP